MHSGLEPAALPADAVEVGRIADAWGIKGWFKVLPHSASPEALFSSRRWFLQPSERGAKTFTGTQLLRIREARDHADTVVASAHDIDDRAGAEALRGARVFVPRSSFPTLDPDEYYWVDLIGLQVLNREGLTLGTVRELMSTGPQTVLVVEPPAASDTANSTAKSAGADKPRDCLIPFVSAYVDQVDLPGRRISVDWQSDY